MSDNHVERLTEVEIGKVRGGTYHAALREKCFRIAIATDAAHTAAAEREQALREEVESYRRTIQIEYDKREALDGEVVALRDENARLADDLRIARHELQLIFTDTERGRTDCSTPIFQRVRNICEYLITAEAEVARLTAESERLIWEAQVTSDGWKLPATESALTAERQKVRELREWLAECGTGTGASEFGFSLGLQRMAGNVLVKMNALGLPAAESPEKAKCTCWLGCVPIATFGLSDERMACAVHGTHAELPGEQP